MPGLLTMEPTMRSSLAIAALARAFDASATLNGVKTAWRPPRAARARIRFVAND